MTAINLYQARTDEPARGKEMEMMGRVHRKLAFLRALGDCLAGAACAVEQEQWEFRGDTLQYIGSFLEGETGELLKMLNYE